MVNVPDPEGDFPGDGSWTESADRFVAEARGDDAVEARRRDRWTRQRHRELTTVAAALDAAIGVPVTLLLTNGDRLPVTIGDLGVDHVEVRAHAMTQWIPLRVIAGLESAQAFVVDPEGLTEPTSTFSEVLEHLAADERQVGVTLTGGQVVRGDIVAVGAALTLRLLDTGHTTILSFDAIDLVTLLDS